MALTRARYAALIVVSDPMAGSPATRAIVESADRRLKAASNPLEPWLDPSPRVRLDRVHPAGRQAGDLPAVEERPRGDDDEQNVSHGIPM